MKEIIHVLPENVANQIAAGEVVQRPASVVKELVENAIDAGATHVDVIVKEAGRTLIQVTDNGSGMGEKDALRCFERHATSKISSADDLFQLQTKGFRGEALASIAAVAHVDLKTRLEEDELGTHVCMEGSRCVEQSACACEKGTTFMVKNLFFNVPARRNFLKSDKVEFNCILDEFLRIVLVTPEVSFRLYHNDKQLYDLPKTVLKQRIINVFGNSYKEKLLPVHQDSQVVRIDGFIGTPASAKKSKGEQYLFVNHRYIKHPYFHHAIQSAVEGVVPADHHLSYFIFFELDPERIDVNIHPTKIEVKFQEEKAVYSILHAAVRHAMGMFNISSNIDFENISPIDFSEVSGRGEVREPPISYHPDYNPFHEHRDATAGSSRTGVASGFGSPVGNTSGSVSSGSVSSGSVSSGSVSSGNASGSSGNASGSSGNASGYTAYPPKKAVVNDSWRQIYESVKENIPSVADFSEEEKQLEMIYAASAERNAANAETGIDWEEGRSLSLFQLNNSYIVVRYASVLFLIQQDAASERVLYERFLHQMESKEAAAVQQLLFPESVTFSPQDAETVRELLPDFKYLGFDMEPFGRNVMIVHGVPADFQEENKERDLQKTLEELLETYKGNLMSLRTNRKSNLARSMAAAYRVKRGKVLSAVEMETIVKSLFQCGSPLYAPSGKKVYVRLDEADLLKLFKDK